MQKNDKNIEKMNEIAKLIFILLVFINGVLLELIMFFEIAMYKIAKIKFNIISRIKILQNIKNIKENMQKIIKNAYFFKKNFKNLSF